MSKASIKAMQRMALFLAVSVALSGCSSMAGKGKISENAKPYAVTVTWKQEYSTLRGAAINSYTNTTYAVKDNKGRISTVISPHNSFFVGNCATLWRLANSDYYPRLTKAGVDCAPLTKEPEGSGGYMYGGDNTYTTRLLDNWLDIPEEQMLKILGEPNTRKSQGETEVVYKKTIHTAPDGSKPWGPGTLYDRCQVTFYINSGVIQRYNTNGLCP